MHTPEAYHHSVSWPPTRGGGDGPGMVQSEMVQVEKTKTLPVPPPPAGRPLSEPSSSANVSSEKKSSETLTVPSQVAGRKPALSEQSSSANVSSASVSDTYATADDEREEFDDEQDLSDLHQRIICRLCCLETEREKKLREDRRIGRCLERKEVKPQMQMVSKRANFKWQRLSTKIGILMSGI